MEFTKSLKNKFTKQEYHDNVMMEILEDILEFSIDKKGYQMKIFPLKSNIGIIPRFEDEDNIFYIDKTNNEKFGISYHTNETDDHYHIDPQNWKRISNNKKEIDIEMNINNNIKHIKFKETSSIEEINRINTIFNENVCYRLL